MRKEIPGSNGFLADEDGNIFNPDGSLRTTYRNGDGYITASVRTDDGRWVTFGVHRLVALAHIPRELPERVEVNHRDGNLERNAKSNLEWVTPRENNIHSELLCEDNQYPRLIILKDNKPFALAKNLTEAEIQTQVDRLMIWDCVKDNLTTENGFSFNYRPHSGAIMEELQKERIRYRNHLGRPHTKAIKMLDLDTGEVLHFSSFYEAAGQFNTSSSHLYQSIPRGRPPRLFRKRYQIAYSDQNFKEWTKEEILMARSKGPKAVYGYNVQKKQSLITTSAKEFIELTGLSRKAVTHALAKDKIRVIDSWAFTYLDPKNVERLKAFVEGPAFAGVS